MEDKSNQAIDNIQPVQIQDTPQSVSPQSTQQQSKQDFGKFLMIIMAVLLLGIGGVGIFLLQKQIMSKPILSDLTPNTTSLSRGDVEITKSVQQPQSAESIQPKENYSDWKAYTNEPLGITFKVPPKESYSLATGEITPSKIMLADRADYSGGSRREEFIRMYQLTANDLKVTEKISTLGQPYLLVEGLTGSAHAEGIDYAAVFAKGSYLVIFKGSLDKAELIKNIAETVNFTGTPVNPKDMLSCVQEPSSQAVKTSTGYSLLLKYKQKLDINYLKKATQFTVIPTVLGSKEPLFAEVPYTVSSQDINEPPFVQQLNFSMTKDQVINGIGQDKFNKATQLGFSLFRAYFLKTVNGKFCGDVGNQTGSIDNFK
ncbi:hypothetical protein A2617_00005 [Candidatus Daviesbacteria bacterium RIFOXYD1_FULL_41_10]|nr:MAG: hypothetical protein A2617_00005 [Candidatus Daviesbacteria bacterium RIFOXYD1_FULL_41_10]